ncbi:MULTISPECIES: hypothetical protein [Paenibacillus]|uniref:hypothetical protein n=1 Tax=Paenibacillus TaxID=44249 RepID=UPI001C8E9D54|nr:hypothetical protein [Paenibacillus typhae]MBY0014089.1 hypothetical protein [Paenibacillus typhae]
MFEGFDFEFGRITYNTYKLSPTDQTDLEWISEDMFQVEYPNGYVLDVGWYGGFDEGIFIIFIIKDCQWSEPLLRREYKDVNKLYEGMKECISIVKGLI